MYIVYVYYICPSGVHAILNGCIHYMNNTVNITSIVPIREHSQYVKYQSTNNIIVR